MPRRAVRPYILKTRGGLCALTPAPDANPQNPMTNVVFEDVRVVNPGSEPWGEDYYDCQGVVGGVAKGSTWPVPPCFEDQTDGAGR